jgi:hypothetical protein
MQGTCFSVFGILACLIAFGVLQADADLDQDSFKRLTAWTIENGGQASHLLSHCSVQRVDEVLP